MSGLDDYILNSKYSQWHEELFCSKCKERWDAIIFSEYGRSYFMDEEKMSCPACGKLEQVEVVSGGK